MRNKKMYYFLLTILFLCFFLLSSSRTYAAGITVDHTSSAGTPGGGASLSWSHSIGSQSNMILLVGVSLGNDGASVASVKYNGVSLTKKADNDFSFGRVDLWYLNNNLPSPGTYTITVTLAGGTAGIAAGAVTFNNVDLTNSPTTPVTNFGYGNSLTTTVSSTTSNQLVMDIFNRIDFDDYTAGSGQTVLWNVSPNVLNASSTKPGGGNVSFTWTNTINSQGHMGSLGFALNQLPDCTNGASGCSACLAPNNTCSNNGSQTCTHTTLANGSNACNPVVFSNTCTINNCDTYHTCSGGSCTLNNCTQGSINCGACGGAAPNTCSNNGTQTCTHNLAPDNTTNCTQVTFGGTVCSVNNCSAGNFCSGGNCIPSNYTISGNIFVDKDNSQRYNPPTDSLNTVSTSLTVKNSSNVTVATLSNITGSYNTTLPMGTYTVIFNGPPAGYYMTYPLTGTPPSFQVTIGPGCTENSNDASCSSNNVINLNFGISNTVAWSQSFCGDVRTDTGIIDKVPATPSCGAVSGAYAVQSTAGICTNSPGIAFTGGTNADFGQGQAAANPYNFVVGGSVNAETYKPAASSIIHTAYAYLSAKLRQNGIVSASLTSYCTGGLSNCTLSAALPHGVYQANSDVTLTGASYTFGANQQYVILINGNLTIKEPIHVPVGSTVTFSVSGNIAIDASVGETTNTSIASDLEGFYSADGSFIINGTPNICSSGSSDKRLNIAGAVITNASLQGGSFVNNRTLCGSNAQCPAISITQRPDFLLFGPQFIKTTQNVWQEVAP